MGRGAVILSSGGLDSTTAMAVARAQGFALHSITFDYGQRHRSELAAAERVARALNAERHLVVPVGLGLIGGSALTDDAEVPRDRPGEAIGRGIPPTYVPARNTVFLALALGWAEVLGDRDIFIGVNAVDFSGYPDCRPEFIAAFERLAGVATRAGVEGDGFTIHAPLMDLTKGGIIRRGLELGVDYSLTFSCYDPEGGLACGRCDACRLRLKGFAEAGAKDPIRYADEK